MWEEIAAFIVSFIAMVLVASSYFFKKKSLYLSVQALGMFGIALSYLFTKEFFAMIGMAISLVRTLTYSAFERKDKETPIWFAFVFLFAGIAGYFIVNFGILHTAKPLDIVYLITLALYGFIFRVRNLKFVRFAMLLPLLLSVVYNLFANATIFVVISYAFEFCASVVAIFKYHIFKQTKEEKSYETC